MLTLKGAIVFGICLLCLGVALLLIVWKYRCRKQKPSARAAQDVAQLEMATEIQPVPFLLAGDGEGGPAPDLDHGQMNPHGSSWAGEPAPDLDQEDNTYRESVHGTIDSPFQSDDQMKKTDIDDIDEWLRQTLEVVANLGVLQLEEELVSPAKRKATWNETLPVVALRRSLHHTKVRQDGSPHQHQKRLLKLRREAQNHAWKQEGERERGGSSSASMDWRDRSETAIDWSVRDQYERVAGPAPIAAGEITLRLEEMEEMRADDLSHYSEGALEGIFDTAVQDVMNEEPATTEPYDTFAADTAAAAPPPSIPPEAAPPPPPPPPPPEAALSLQ
jgi:hypothetical protein